MSKLAMAEAMPWNLSISVDSILLKNLVLIGLTFVALRLSSTKNVIRELLSIPEVRQNPYYKQESPRILREHFRFLV